MGSAWWTTQRGLLTALKRPFLIAAVAGLPALIPQCAVCRVPPLAEREFSPQVDELRESEGASVAIAAGGGATLNACFHDKGMLPCVFGVENREWTILTT